MSMQGGNNNVEASAEAYARRVVDWQEGEANACRASFHAWAAFADAHGLKLSSDDSASTRRAEGMIDDIQVEVAIVVDKEGWRHTLLTLNPRVPDAGVLVAIRPAPTGVVNALKSALFGQEGVKTGDDDFDRRFVVRAEPDAAATRLLDEELRGLLLRWLGRPLEAIEYDRGVIYVQSAGVEVKEEALAHALSVALRLAAWVPEATTAYR